jgi:hypothetical protein
LKKNVGESMVKKQRGVELSIAVMKERKKERDLILPDEFASSKRAGSGENFSKKFVSDVDMNISNITIGRKDTELVLEITKVK